MTFRTPVEIQLVLWELAIIFGCRQNVLLPNTPLIDALSAHVCHASSTGSAHACKVPPLEI